MNGSRVREGHVFGPSPSFLCHNEPNRLVMAELRARKSIFKYTLPVKFRVIERAALNDKKSGGCRRRILVSRQGVLVNAALDGTEEKDITYASKVEPEETSALVDCRPR